MFERGVPVRFLPGDRAGLHSVSGLCIGSRMCGDTAPNTLRTIADTKVFAGSTTRGQFPWTNLVHETTRTGR